MRLNDCLASAAVFALACTALAACSDEQSWPDVDGKAPMVDLQQDHIMTARGREIRFAGTVSDADGLASVALQCPELKLDKTIDLLAIYEEPLTAYTLDYAFHMADKERGDDFDVLVTATDIGGRTTQGHVLVTMDADFTAPNFMVAPDKELLVLIKPVTTFNLRFTVHDNRAIDYVEVDVAGVDGYPQRIEGNGRKTIEYAQKLALPPTKGSYRVDITAYDCPAQDGEVRSASVSSVVNVDQTPDFDKLWLCDVANPSQLNSDIFGVPMLVDHTGPYQYSARYYNEKAGTKICFLAQKTDFSPICYGPDPQYNGLLGDDPETAGRITLDQAGVYYKIDFNIQTGQYSLATYSVAEAADPVAHMHYGADDLNTWNDWATAEPWWQRWYFGPITDGPRDVMEMRRDADNPHIYILDEWKLNAGDKLHFVLHNWHHDGWWNYTTWRVDDSQDPEKFMYYGLYFNDNAKFASNADWFAYRYAGQTVDLDKWNGSDDYRKQFVPDNWCDLDVATTGTYKLIFDAHLERARLIPAK